MSAVQPRFFILPLQIGLWVMLHCKCASRKVIDICNGLGLCLPYKHESWTMIVWSIVSYEQSNSNFKPGTFVQLVIDNADFNVDTIDGKNTFHNIGSIEIVTPSSGIEPQQPFKRLKQMSWEGEIAQIANIPIEIYNHNFGDGLKTRIVSILDDDALCITMMMRVIHEKTEMMKKHTKISRMAWGS